MQRHPSPGAPKSRFRRRSRTGRTSCGCSLEFALQHLNRSRYYDTGQGRFLSNDNYRGSSLAPPSLHRYTYVHNDPVRYVDPRGRSIALPALLVFGIVAFMFIATHIIHNRETLSVSAFVLLEDVTKYMRSAAVHVIMMITVLVAIIQAQSWFAVVTASEEGEVVPFPTTKEEDGTEVFDEVTFNEMDKDGCLLRYVRSKNWIQQRYPDFAIGSVLVFYAYRQFAKCKLGQWNVVFPGEGPFPMPEL